MRIIYFIFLVTASVFASASPNVMLPVNGKCKSGYFLLSDVCVQASLLGDVDSMVDAIMEFKDPSYAAQKEQLRNLQQQAEVTARSSRNNPRVVPLPPSGYIYSKDGKYVACTGDFNFYKTAEKNVCAGGRYNFYTTHRDSVACGGQYNFYSTHRGSVCAGGQYNFYATHRGSVACGGKYNFYSTHREDVCAGGLCNFYTTHRGKVACGGQYDGWQDGKDASQVCVGGKFQGCVHSKDGTYVACGGWAHIYREE